MSWLHHHAWSNGGTVAPRISEPQSSESLNSRITGSVHQTAGSYLVKTWLKKSRNCTFFQETSHFCISKFEIEFWICKDLLNLKAWDLDEAYYYCVGFPQTFSQREKRQQLQEKRKALKDGRLAKVRQRKLQKLKEAGSEVTNEALDLADFDFDSTGKKDDGKSNRMFITMHTLWCFAIRNDILVHQMQMAVHSKSVFFHWSKTHYNPKLFRLVKVYYNYVHRSGCVFFIVTT